MYGNLNQCCFPAEDMELASGTLTALARSSNRVNHTSLAASVHKLLVVFTAPTQLGQSNSRKHFNVPSIKHTANCYNCDTVWEPLGTSDNKAKGVPQ